MKQESNVIIYNSITDSIKVIKDEIDEMLAANEFAEVKKLVKRLNGLLSEAEAAYTELVQIGFDFEQQEEAA